MRHNMMGETYCHSHADIVEAIEEKGLIASDDLFAEVMADEDTPGTWSAEVKHNGDGETAFWCEGYTSKHDLVEDLKAVGFKRGNITDL